MKPDEAKTINTSRAEKKSLKYVNGKLCCPFLRLHNFSNLFSQMTFVKKTICWIIQRTLFFDGRPTNLRPSLIWDISTIPRNPIRPKSPRKNLFSQISSSYHAKKNPETWYDLLFAAWAFIFMAVHFSRRDDCFSFSVKFTFLFTFLFPNTISLLQNDENGARRKVKMSSNVMSDCVKTALKGAEKLRNPRRCSVTKCVVKSFLLLCFCWDPSIHFYFALSLFVSCAASSSLDADEKLFLLCVRNFRLRRRHHNTLFNMFWWYCQSLVVITSETSPATAAKSGLINTKHLLIWELSQIPRASPRAVHL